MSTIDETPGAEARNAQQAEPSAAARTESSWDQGERPSFLFRFAAHIAGFLAMLGIGWACATCFLVADLAFDLGMNTDDGDPILPFMMWLALPIVVLSLVAIGVAVGASAEWARRRPYSVMLRLNYLFLVLATLVAVLAWRTA